ncbi:MAG: hypothetical protein COB85_07625 [Bacteroidetes bacterium]|nr:MAG: hypothetical protein COB85_07625 [Bacteroidota bacterium]
MINTFLITFVSIPNHLNKFLMDAVFYGIGDACQGLFDLMPHLGNIPNGLIVASILGLFFIWTSRLIQYRNAGDNE